MSVICNWKRTRGLYHTGGVAFGLVMSANLAFAAGQTVIDLTYDSVKDMVRPEVHPNIAVHHNLQAILSKGNKVSERRDRSTKGLMDKNAMRQVLGSSGDAGSYAA
jgi:hypothetical protein